MGWFVVLPYFIYLLFFHFPSYTLSLCNHHDLSALLLFNNSFAVNTSPDYWPSLSDRSSYSSKTTSWKNSTDCCEWDGVTCDTISGHVIGLDLSCSRLQGKFHPNTTLFHLTHLQQLNLASNDIFGSIYPGIGDLVNLTHLNLSSTGFYGDIPSTISHLSKLVSLDLSSNYILRLDPSTWKKLILNASDVRELFLDYVDMFSIRGNSLVNLSTSLVSLSLGYTGLQGDLPTEVLCLPNLQKLILLESRILRGQLPKSNWSTPLRYLDLSLIPLSGGIPNSIGHLKSLNQLSLKGCKLDGPIPLSLWNLTQLTFLDLYFNNLTGEIPSLLSNLKNLTLLDLSFNNLEGPIPSKITNLSKLNYLSLGFNKLNGTIPRWCYYLPSLSVLRLHDNQLTGSINEFSTYSMKSLSLFNNKLQGNFPNSIYEFESLTDLDLSSNDLSGVVDFNQFSKLKNVTFMNLSKNNFLCINVDSNDDHIFPNLDSLYLSSCNIKHFPKFLARLHNLYKLDLSNNKIHGNIPKWFRENLLFSWRIIHVIDLSFNQLQGDLPIPPLGTRFFSVSNNNFSGDICSTICNASSLMILNLSHNNLSGMIPQCLGSFPSLSILDMQRNKLQGIIPRNFSKGNTFQTIKLNGNRLEGSLPESLAQCTNLEVLDLGDNNIDDIFPSWLETLQELKVLSLRSNKFHGSITCLHTNHPFSKLRIFDVSSNHFSGLLPTSCINSFQGMMNVNDSQNGLKYLSYYDAYNERYNDSVVVIMKGQYVELVRILTIFTTIDLSNNMFEGEIPKVIGELNSLIGLNLSHNGITGSIPQYLSNLRSLEWLDLSWNQLTGEIPMALTNLNFLSFLNLSENQFDGMIPKGGQFNTFENVSYEGNPMLCGLPLPKLCNKNEEWPPQSTLHYEEESGFGWKAVVVGYASGVILGVLLGYSVLFTGNPQWLARLVRRYF